MSRGCDPYYYHFVWTDAPPVACSSPDLARGAKQRIGVFFCHPFIGSEHSPCGVRIFVAAFYAHVRASFRNLRVRETDSVYIYSQIKRDAGETN